MSYAELRTWAEMFNDVQQFRIAMENKVRSATVGEEVVAPFLQQYRDTEKGVLKLMRKSMRKTVVPEILEWQKARDGIGEALLARLLGVTGDPRIAQPYHWEGKGKDDRILVAADPFPRTVSQLWSYCGHGDPMRKRAKGMTADEATALGNPMAKMLVWNLAAACLKAGVRKLEHCDDTDGYDIDGRKSDTHYGQVFLGARRKYEEREHASECVRCGPSGKPAQPGSPWSPAHQQAAALRLVGKTILKDLWIAAGDHGGVGTHTSSVPGGDQ